MRLTVAQIATALAVFCLLPLLAQDADKPTTTVPRLVRVTGTFRPANGLPVGITESATLSMYRDEQGGQPLWQETQNVTLDANGQYTATLGITQKDGVPVDLFSSTEPRWLGVQFNRPGEVEQARVQLVSVPYALKASDAETLGGRPASAYLLDPSAVAIGTGNNGSGTIASSPNPKSLKPRAITGNVNYLPYFTDASNDLGNSLLYQSGTNIGLGTTTPLISLDVRTGSLPQMGIAQTTDYLTFFASDIFGPAIYWDPMKDMRFGKGGPSLFNPYGFVEQMRIQSSTGNVGIGTTTPGSKLDVAGDINMSGKLLYNGSPILSAPSGGNDIALGGGALANNAVGGSNTGIGSQALFNNTGSVNTAIGFDALWSNRTGVQNTATGVQALEANFNGCCNTATGYLALSSNTTGNNNIAIGYQAALNVSGTNSNNDHIGTLGSASDNGTIRLGAAVGYPCRLTTCGPQTSFFAAGISGVQTGLNNAVPVLIDGNGQLGTVNSSRRYKEDIQDMADASNGLMQLRPVTFRYQKPFADGSKPIQYGLIAEEVAEVYPDLVAHSADGQIETVKYQVLDSMLLNELQRLNRENQALMERLSKLEAEMAKAAGGAGVQ